MIVILQAILDAVLAYAIFRLWRRLREARTAAPAADTEAAVKSLARYRAELSELLDSIEATAQRERESLFAAVRAAREGLKGERERESRGQRPDGRSLREAVRDLGGGERSAREIAAALGVGVREVNLMLRAGETKREAGGSGLAGEREKEAAALQ